MGHLSLWDFWIDGINIPPENGHDNGTSTIWRCISYWTWGCSNVMLVFRGVHQINRFAIEVHNTWGFMQWWQVKGSIIYHRVTLFGWRNFVACCPFGFLWGDKKLWFAYCWHCQYQWWLNSEIFLSQICSAKSVYCTTLVCTPYQWQMKVCKDALLKI